MMRRIDRTYTLSAVEVRDAVLYWLANAKDYPVPPTYDDALITWDNTHEAVISWNETINDDDSGNQ